MDTPELSDLSERVVLLLAEQGVRDGDVRIKDRSKQEIADDVRNYLTRAVELIPNYDLTLDYQETLETEAHSLVERGQFQIAIVLYATRVEQWLNHMILWGAGRHSREKGFAVDASPILRQSNLTPKLGWIWSLLFEEEMPKKLRRQITELTEARNAFVHYKWQGFPIDGDDGQARLRALCELAPELMAALAALEEDMVFAGERAVIAEVLAGMKRRP